MRESTPTRTGIVRDAVRARALKAANAKVRSRLRSWQVQPAREKVGAPAKGM